MDGASILVYGGPSARVEQPGGPSAPERNGTGWCDEMRGDWPAERKDSDPVDWIPRGGETARPGGLAVSWGDPGPRPRLRRGDRPCARAEQETAAGERRTCCVLTPSAMGSGWVRCGAVRLPATRQHAPLAFEVFTARVRVQSWLYSNFKALLAEFSQILSVYTVQI